jgi:branched-chain amino acid transport system permease protein
VLFSPDGVIGLWERWQRRNRSEQARSGGGSHG